jgi:hypothetical protein
MIWYLVMFVLGYMSRPLLVEIGRVILKMHTEAWRKSR